MSTRKKDVIFIVLMYILMGIPAVAFCDEPNIPVYDPNDPNNWFPSLTDAKLKLWLSAYDLKQQGMKEGEAILQWVDRTNFGTIFSPREGMMEEPRYGEIQINGKLRPAVHFQSSGTPLTPGNRDRLWQVNNKGATNPLNSGPGEALTVIAVWANADSSGAYSATDQPIITFRGTNAAPWMLGQAAGSQVDYGIYFFSGGTKYPSNGPVWPGDTLGVALMQIDSSDVLNFFQDTNGDALVALTPGNTQNTHVGRAGPEISPETEGAGIGCHDQDGQGELETFTGYICEIIVYGRAISAQELTDIQAYLTDKYFREPLQPNAADTSLRLWLSAYDLQDQGMSPGDPVLQWVDKSSYGTIFAPRDTVAAEKPGYAEVLINSVDIPCPALWFDLAEDGSPDRLWQTTNKVSNNPLAIGNGEDLTVIGVWANYLLPGGGSPYNTIIAMRGTGSCPWYLGQGAGGHLSDGIYYVTYAGQVQWTCGGPNWLPETFGVGMMQISAANVLNFFQDYDGDSLVTLEQTNTQDASVAVRNGPSIAPEGAGIACHDQDCCGEGESFSGYISEIFVYKKLLSEPELSDIEQYLNEKYFSSRGSYCTQYPAADFNNDCVVDLQDFAQFSQGWLECNIEPQSLCP